MATPNDDIDKRDYPVTWSSAKVVKWLGESDVGPQLRPELVARFTAHEIDGEDILSMGKDDFKEICGFNVEGGITLHEVFVLERAMVLLKDTGGLSPNERRRYLLPKAIWPDKWRVSHSGLMKIPVINFLYDTLDQPLNQEQLEKVFELLGLISVLVLSIIVTGFDLDYDAVRNAERRFTCEKLHDTNVYGTHYYVSEATRKVYDSDWRAMKNETPGVNSWPGGLDDAIDRRSCELHPGAWITQEYASHLTYAIISLWVDVIFIVFLYLSLSASSVPRPNTREMWEWWKWYRLGPLGFCRTSVLRTVLFLSVVGRGLARGGAGPH